MHKQKTKTTTTKLYSLDKNRNKFDIPYEFSRIFFFNSHENSYCNVESKRRTNTNGIMKETVKDSKLLHDVAHLHYNRIQG